MGRIAELLGRTLRLWLVGVAMLPGLVGPAFLIYGAAMIYAPLGWILAGLLLLAIDFRIKPTRRGPQ